MNFCGADAMNSSESDPVRKEKLLQRLASLTPAARMAVLEAALEQKVLRTGTQKSKDPVQDRRLGGSV